MNSVERELLADSQIDRDLLDQTLNNIYQRKIDLADLYFQSSCHESWMLEDGIVKEGSYNIERGVGVRAISGEKTGFAYSDDISPIALQKAADAAKGIANAKQNGRVLAFKNQTVKSVYEATDPLGSLAQEQKITLMHEIEAHARSVDKRVQQVIVSLSGVYEKILVAASDGTFATDIRPLVRLNCSVLVEDNGKRERGSAGGGARTDYSYFFELENGKPRLIRNGLERKIWSLRPVHKVGIEDVELIALHSFRRRRVAIVVRLVVPEQPSRLFRSCTCCVYFIV